MGISNINGLTPYVFDASDVGGTIPAIPFTWTKQRIALGTIYWNSVAAAQGDTLIIQDVNGKEIWRSTATGADWEDDFKWPDTNYSNGFVIAQFPNGILTLQPR